MANIHLPRKFVSKYPHKFGAGKKRFLSGKRILPKPITGKEKLDELIGSATPAGCSPKKCWART